MKKVLVTLLVAGSMIAGTTAGFAATTAKPTIKPATPKASSKEGTATHEMSENSETQKNEAKPAKKATIKPMATTKAKSK
jgi:Ni/Co efflux regulator RcnB